MPRKKAVARVQKAPKQSRHPAFTEAIRDTLVLRPAVVLSGDSHRPTQALIDLDAIAENFGTIRRLAKATQVLAVVKADAYGHGVVPVAKRLEKEGAVSFGVALAEEGLELREAGIKAPILIMNGVYGQAYRDVLESKLTPVVYHSEHLARFAACTESPFEVHLKIDTGMSRLGVKWQEVPTFIEELNKFPRCQISGVLTHLAAADTDAEYTRLQLERFRESLRLLRSAGHRPRIIHAANTAATFRHPDSYFDMVRVGGGLFGINMVDKNQPQLMPTFSLVSQIVDLRTVHRGESVGYDATFTAKKDTRVATVPIGYGDGYLRSLSGKGVVLVSGVRCPLLGRVSMDLVTIDVTGVPAELGDPVTLMGRQGQERVTADELARLGGTIAYDVLTSVSRRVPRVYGP